MTPSVRYWIRRHRDGSIAELVRIREDPGVALRTEFFRGGRWYDDNSVGSYRIDPLEGDEISPEEAAEKVRELGFQWPGEPPPWPIVPREPDGSVR